MKTYRFDVIIVGAGPAGVTAAGALAGSGLTVALIEAGVYAGAENWSGCVYFAESLASDEVFGIRAVENAPFERRVVRRGTFVHNGIDEVGASLSDARAFENCYTVLRPVYDPYFADLARSKGATLITGTTVLSLIRKDGRVAGVQTDRGPLYGGVTFIAEGDASHLVRSERLERVPAPHYLQGVKAVLSLPPEEIDKRFRLGRSEGAAYEILVRNPAIAGRTSRLNIGGFLYTNRDSLSVGYVLPLENLRDQYRGGHDALFEWLKGLPSVRDLTSDAALSAYGTKIIRSGGWRERPVLVEDGLAVGGASAGLGIDLPFPNFTGPASATGLYFARGVKALLGQGKPLTAVNLAESYLAPLQESVYGRNANYLSRWPKYFSTSRVLFGGTADLLCGTARFAADGSIVETGRFLRGQLFSPRAMKDTISDTFRLITSLGLGRHLLLSLVHPTTLGGWVLNLFKRRTAMDSRLRIIVNINGTPVDAMKLPWPAGYLVRRTSLSLTRALFQVYANDGRPLEKKLPRALRKMVRSLSLTDIVVLPLYGLALAVLAAGTAVWDAFRYYVLRTPASQLLVEPVMAYREALRKARGLGRVNVPVSLESKLATNTYRVGAVPHIRTLWPERISKQQDMAASALWWICPARVYAYDAPPLAGRGKVTVNWENCIKCESCWRAVPGHVLWGRFSGHRLIYRPASGAIDSLLASIRKTASAGMAAAAPPTEEQPLLSAPGAEPHRAAVLNAAQAFKRSLQRLPPSADSTRRAWPRVLGTRLGEKLMALEEALQAGGLPGPVIDLRADREALAARLAEGSLYHALSVVLRLEDRLGPGQPHAAADAPEQQAAFTYAEASALFPDRVVKEWEDAPMPDEWTTKLEALVVEHRAEAGSLVRALSSVSPALGLIASQRLQAMAILEQSGRGALPAVIAVDGSGLTITPTPDGATLTGTLSLVPLAGATSLLIIAGGRSCLLPLAAAGITVTPAPAIGFRASRLSHIALDCTVTSRNILPALHADQGPVLHLAIALGAIEYLSRRAKEHALGRVQFSGQLLDTEGRDGIAKFGAVKALVARVEAWRLVLETVYDSAVASDSHSALREDPSPPLPLPLRGREKGEGHVYPHSALLSSLAAFAFGPESGCPAYDAGQVFGGFAYSEDDLLSRFYRDSSLFRFLAPGHGAARELRGALAGVPLEQAFADALGSLDGITGTPLDDLVRKWGTAAHTLSGIPAHADRTLAGEAAALLIGIRGMIVRCSNTLDRGSSQEMEAAGIEVLLGLADDAIARARLSAGRGAVAPTAAFPTAPALPQVPLDLAYEDFCALPGDPYRSGRFLLSLFDRSPRYVPEMQLHDEALRTRWVELAGWFRENCRDRDWNGLGFERTVEKLHSLPPEVIAAVREKKWLATYIPRSEDGLGWRKADYYILNSAAGSFGDAALCLLIMASTSIGTTPVLLGLEDELPRVREELSPLVSDPSRLGEIGSRLDRIISSFRNPNPARIRRDYQALMGLVDSRIRHTRVVKYLAANFLRSFYGAGMAGRRGDAAGFMTGLGQAAELFRKIMPDVQAALDELPRRERSHKLFLRNLGHGGVSAFALTEPTAGSDSGGVKTTARLHSANLYPLPDGRWSFFLREGDDASKRYVIDADRIVFTEQGMAYRTPDDTVCAISTDRVPRSYTWKGGECLFHDIAQVRKKADQATYEYYSLTGAKMWITNGSIATQFSLFAQAPEGVTGFMVDRFAEGLTVGADERKTGQRGSPTNELSLDSVRVAREAVIGYEGHGQVNALETLNVGRCGLAVVAGSLMRKLLDEALRDVPASAERDLLLGEAAAVLFGSESLAYTLIGLFDRPHESVRMESAIAKYICAEDLHEFLTLIERAYGPAGQTETFLLEKARRDSRILNIYEGTNEVQRFLILKDLISQAADWPELPERLHERPGDRAAMLLAQKKNALRKHALAAASRFGDTAWSDAMLQPALFPLAEMAGEVCRLEAVIYRREWLEAHADRLGAAYVGPMIEAGMRAADRSLARLDQLEEKFRQTWKTLAADMTLPEVRAADAALDLFAEATALRRDPVNSLGIPIRILSILRPAADLSPAPRLKDGRLEELVWQTDPRDRSALVQALAIKAAAQSSVVVDVLLPGGPEHEHLLGSLSGTDHQFRLECDGADLPGAVSAAVRDMEVQNRYDMIVTGAVALDGDRTLGPFLAGSLGRAYLGVDRVRVRKDGKGLDDVSLPAVAGISTADDTIRTGLERTLGNPVAVMMSGVHEGTRHRPRFSSATAGAAPTEAVSTVEGAARFLRTFAAALSASAAPDHEGDVKTGVLAQGPAVWAFVDPGNRASARAALKAAAAAAGHFGLTARALIAAPKAQWAGLLGLAKANGCHTAFCFSTGMGTLSPAGRTGVLHLILKASGAPRIFGGTGWNDAFASAAGELAAKARPVPVFTNAIIVKGTAEGTMLLGSSAYEGKLTKTVEIGDDMAFITVDDGAEPGPPAASTGFEAFQVTLPQDEAWFAPLPEEAKPNLRNADVIIDIGYGVRDRTGMELAQELGKVLEGMGLSPMFGATRKVTQDLKLLPLDLQIGQTGVRVNPKLIIALGISGAPQHIDYLGTRADVLCFNKDPEAPFMKLNQTRSGPSVHPIAGDLFATVKELIGKLGGNY
ncbi:MAG: acyl-CoA dehydrogenase family protein [Nitrospirota bacterium]